MQDFASTGNGRRFLSDVGRIAKALEKLAKWSEDQVDPREVIWKELYDSNTIMYNGLKNIEEGDITFSGASEWTRRLKDYLRELKINYTIWTFYRADRNGKPYNTGHEVLGRLPKIEDFDDQNTDYDIQIALHEAASATVRVVAW